MCVSPQLTCASEKSLPGSSGHRKGIHLYNHRYIRAVDWFLLSLCLTDYVDGTGHSEFAYRAQPSQSACPCLSLQQDCKIGTAFVSCHISLSSMSVCVCVQVNKSVLTEPQLHSLLPLPGITAVPGDRFRELYYWDSFWVIKGLLVSGMTETATSEVKNLLSLLETYGHVPNGARVYYVNRRSV